MFEQYTYYLMPSMKQFITPTVPKIRFRQVALPIEHGGWGFLFESLIAGLAIAFSPAAPWIALMTLGAFLTRQPLRIFILDRLGMRFKARAVAALIFVGLFSSIFFIGAAGTMYTTHVPALTPFLFVLPLAVMQMYWDVNRKSRELIPQLSGAISMSSSIAVMALAAGMSWPIAVALWILFVSRGIPSILYVRERLKLEKGKDFSRSLPTIAHIAAFICVAVLAYNRLLPYLVIFAMAILLLRTVTGLSPRRRKLKAMQIGVREAIYGTLVVLSLIVGHYTGF